MKKLTRLLSLLLAVAMVLSLNLTALTVSAADTYTITISTTTKLDGNETGTTDTTSHTYEAYQIFAGDYDTTSGALSNITWGTGLSDSGITALLSALNSDNDLSTYRNDNLPSSNDNKFTTAQEYADYLTTLSSNFEALEKEAERLATYNTASKKYTYLASQATGTSQLNTSSNEYEITGLSAGYYLVLDKYGSLSTTTTGADQVYTQYILQVVKNVEINPKEDIPSVTKKVDDINDTTGNSETLQDSADYDIGDDVPFTLTGTLPANYADYNTYYYAFHDTEETGLTFDPTSVKVYVDVDGTGSNKKQVGSTYYTILLCDDYDTNSEYDTPTHSACTFEIVLTNLNNLYDTSSNKITVSASSKIIVEYTSELNENAVIGAGGNKNTVYLEYSNNQYTDEKGKTTEDTNIVFTYELDVTKVKASDGSALNGAGFSLYKKLLNQPASGTTTLYYNSSSGAFDLDTEPDTPYRYTIDGVEYYYDETNYYKLVKTITLDSANIFEFVGIDDGTYLLVETKTPDGYNTITPIEFEVTASHTNDPSTLALESLSVSGITGATATTSTGKIAATISNSTGATMPETGGMGTKIFYTLGGILVVGAGVLLIVKRRMKNA